jgi:Flp pilus assembly pilin Flp
MMNFVNSAIVNAQAALTVATDRLSDHLSDRSEGQAMVEYGLILVLVSVVAIVGLTVIGGQLYSNALVDADLTSFPGAAAKFKFTGTGIHAPGVFNQLILALSNGTQYK